MSRERSICEILIFRDRPFQYNSTLRLVAANWEETMRLARLSPDSPAIAPITLSSLLH